MVLELKYILYQNIVNYNSFEFEWKIHFQQNDLMFMILYEHNF